MKRSRVIWRAFACLLFVGLSVSPCRADDIYTLVTEKAQQLAQNAYQPPHPLPPILTQLSYDQWRQIRANADKAIWKNEQLPFQIQFFHPGFVYDHTVEINLVEDDTIWPLAIGRDLFDYSKLAVAPQIPEITGAAGFRIHSPIKTSHYFDEFMVFLGGSYLRAVGRDDGYGLSARGLAIDTAHPDGEEFPWFREFWIVKPQPAATTLTVYALLDSKRVSGAYRFVIKPGEETVVDVSSQIFFRDTVSKLGIAPLTSMYFFGENDRMPGMRDFRPEVHDSDGLLIHNASGEWFWRPLLNPRLLQSNGFATDELQGFGLLQRDRNFDHYQDIEAQYQNRPSLWIEPTSPWGRGQVDLVQIPTKDEIHDNIVAFFVPERKPEAGQSMTFDYRMVWGKGTAYPPQGGKVIATRVDRSAGELRNRILVDFSGPDLTSLTSADPVSAVVTVGPGGRLLGNTLELNPYDNSWRLVIDMEMDQQTALDKVLPDKGDAVEVRAFLRHGTDVLTETWSYRLNRRVNR